MVETILMRAEPLVAQVKKDVSRKVEDIKERTGRAPKLVALLIGSDPVSRTYVDLKRNDCADVGILSEVIDLSNLPTGEIQPRLFSVIDDLNSDVSVTAVIPQMPFNGRVSEEEVFGRLSPDKDVDGMTPYRLGKLMRKEYDLR